MLQFTALRAAAAGEDILPFFDYQRGLVDLVTRRSRYAPDWVRVFYATVYVEADRLSIRFMFMGQQQRLTREGIAELLQVDLHDDYIHFLAYPDVETPRHAHSLVLPSDEEISFLFLQSFLPGTPRTPVLTQNVHSTPITQQAEKLASHAQRESDVPVNFS
jgi:hypothetical protein